MVSFLSKHEIEEISMVYRIPKTLTYSCVGDQSIDGLVCKKNNIIVYVKNLKARLCFPLDPFVVAILKLFRVSIA